MLCVTRVAAAERHKFRWYVESRETQETRPSRGPPHIRVRFKPMFFNLRAYHGAS